MFFMDLAIGILSLGHYKRAVKILNLIIHHLQVPKARKLIEELGGWVRFCNFLPCVCVRACVRVSVRVCVWCVVVNE